MESLPVTLIVKAPNQQIDDQTVKCELSWTINKLKQHLSEVYPSKPPKDEQKLIYSGQLLNDSVVLKDVLRQYEGQETYTVHLVCSQKREFAQKKNTTNSTASNVAVGRENVNVTQHRISTENVPTNNEPPRMPSWDRLAMGMDPQYAAAHMAAMQQAYIQYINQYMQLAANSQIYQTGPPGTDEAPAAEPNENQAAERVGRGQRDAPENDRDWLDNFYAISRLLILFSVVYFYSSFVRFSFVLILGVVIYLYQIGFFRAINNNNNNNNVQAGGDPTAGQDEQAPSRFTLIWTFFTTFFASLLPEVPNAV